MREGVRKMDWEKVMEEQWGRAFVHESGHALMDILQGIACHGIYFEKGVEKFCNLTDLPNPTDFSKKHYLYMVGGSAAELIIYGSQDEAGAKRDRLDFQNQGAPSLEEAIDEAHKILLDRKRHLKELVSILKTKCHEAGLDLDALPEMGMTGTDRKFAVLLSKSELEAVVQRGD